MSKGTYVCNCGKIFGNSWARVGHTASCPVFKKDTKTESYFRWIIEAMFLTSKQSTCKHERLQDTGREKWAEIGPGVSAPHKIMMCKNCKLEMYR